MEILASFMLTVFLKISEILGEISPAEFTEALSIPMGKPSKEKLSCLVSSDPVDHLADITQAVFSRTWPRNEVPYKMDLSLTRSDRMTIAKAMDKIKNISCIRFIPFKAETHVLSVRISRECECMEDSLGCNGFKGAFATIGPLLNGRLVISGACIEPEDPRSVALLVHELLHTLGLLHHHERIDREKHIKINYFNIGFPIGTWNYKWNPLYFPNGIPYDCSSIMHYDDRDFSNGKGPTMTPRDPSSCSLDQLNTDLTLADIELLNRMYNCQEGNYEQNEIYSEEQELPQYTKHELLV